MRKTIIMLCTAAVLAGAAFAQAPELKNMMPNSWKKLARLSEAEERAFLRDEAVQGESQKWIDEEFSRRQYNKVNIRVYSETNSGIKFYRVLICNDDFGDFLSTEYRDRTMTQEECDKFRSTLLLQIVFMQDRENKMRNIKVLSYSDHGASTSKWEGFRFNDLMIKPLNDAEIGFFVTEVTTGFYLEGEGDKVDIIYGKKKQQQAGGNSTWFSKYNIKDDIVSAWSKEGIDIQASSCLFDPKCPLKYSIQNAFDGDPATSYVENTEDDLMKISFPGYGYDYSGNFTISIINGYGSNEILYNKNNRVKKIDIVGYKLNDSKTELVEREPKTVEFKDEILNYQLSSTDFICFGPFYFEVSDIYHGSVYNDTCIAELNFKDNKGWFLEK